MYTPYVPSDLNIKYTKSHEWVRDNGDGTVTVGITDYVKKKINGIIYVTLPEIGAEYAAKDECASLDGYEDTYWVSTPAPGVIVQVNEKLADSPEKVDDDPYGNGWMFVMRVTDKDVMFNVTGDMEQAIAMEEAVLEKGRDNVVELMGSQYYMNYCNEL